MTTYELHVIRFGQIVDDRCPQAQAKLEGLLQRGRQLVAAVPLQLYTHGPAKLDPKGMLTQGPTQIQQAMVVIIAQPEELEVLENGQGFIGEAESSGLEPPEDIGQGKTGLEKQPD